MGMLKSKLPKCACGGKANLYYYNLLPQIFIKPGTSWYSQLCLVLAGKVLLRNITHSSLAQPWLTANFHWKWPILDIARSFRGNPKVFS